MADDDIRDLANYVEGYKHAGEDLSEALPHLVAQNKALVEENERLLKVTRTQVKRLRLLTKENERLRAALRVACDDGWPDGEQAMKDYLRGAAQEQSDDALAQPKEER